MARGSMKSKQEDLERALKGLIQPHQKMILKSMLDHIGSLDAQLSTLDGEIEKDMLLYDS